ncbi:MAG: M6 family metalloprotease domain-containing protein [Elusimicrobia bacterium]|nr:M6 family metalloprotease domain-containing protein [Elusimicrobiota bacterium]
MKKTSTFLILHLSSFILFLASSLYAVPHINGKNPGPKEYVHQHPDIKILKETGLSQQVIAKTIGTTGTRKIAVILVDLEPNGVNTSGNETMTNEDKIGFNDTLSFLKNFYKEASYSLLDIEFTFFYYSIKDSVAKSTPTLEGIYNEMPFPLSRTMSYYGEDTDASLSQLIIDALREVNNYPDGPVIVSYPEYDGVMVAHAGYGNETTQNSGDIWSAYVGPFTETNGFTEGINVPAKELDASSIGVTCHEFGHYLGLWDLYSTGISRYSQVGYWSLMDYGVWVNNGYNPTQPSAWEKYKLGWLTPTEISDGTYYLTSYTFEISSSSVYRLKTINSETEYFILCNTSTSTYSTKLPGSGLLIWHIDEGTIEGTTFAERAANNSLNNYAHRTVDVEEADDTDPSTNYGDSTDIWPGTREIFCSPYANNYDGQENMLRVYDISNDVQSSNFTVAYKPFIRGYIKDSAGRGIQDVGVTLSGTIVDYTTTNTDGYYIFSDLENGPYTITPALTNWKFLPGNITATITKLPLSNNDFIGIANVSYLNLIDKPNNIKPINNLFVPGAEKTTIYYKTSNDGNVTVKIYTLDGRFIKTLVSEYISAGTYFIGWDGKNSDNNTVASGIYLIHITAPGYKETKKICVIR